MLLRIATRMHCAAAVSHTGFAQRMEGPGGLKDAVASVLVPMLQRSLVRRQHLRHCVALIACS
jgi:hypothetical protein